MSSGQIERGWGENRSKNGKRILIHPWGSSFSTVSIGQYVKHNEWLSRCMIPGILIAENWKEEIDTASCIVRSEQAYWLDAKQVYRTFSLQQITKLLGDITKAVSDIHDCGLIMAEISEENVLLQGDGDDAKAMLAGFFSAVSPDDEEELFLTVPDYGSPEARRYAAGNDQIHLTVASDIFSLGMLFYQYLTGAMPSFEEYTPEGIPDGRVKLSSKLTQYHKNLIEKMLEIDPQERLSDVQEVEKRLRRIQEMGDCYIQVQWYGHAEEILTVFSKDEYRSWKRLDKDGTARFGPMLADVTYTLYYQSKPLSTLRFPEAKGKQRIFVHLGRTRTQEKTASARTPQHAPKQKNGFEVSPPVNNICWIEPLTDSRCRLTLINNGTFQMNIEDAERYGIAHILKKLMGR